MRKDSVRFFEKNGYCIINLFNSNQISDLKELIVNKMNYLAKDLGFNLKSKDIKKYHKFKISDETHSLLTKPSTRNFLLSSKIRKKIILNKKILKIIKKYWGHTKFKIKWVGSLSADPLKQNFAGFRIVRPKRVSEKDVGSEHLDLHYGGQVHKNAYKALVTIWCPLEGFSEKFSLRISPKSHLTKHSVQAVSKQKKYVSRVFKKNYINKFFFHRPRLKKGQVIFFHPNLIHGESFNFGKQTRVSIDLRIFNEKL